MDKQLNMHLRRQFACQTTDATGDRDFREDVEMYISRILAAN